MTTSTRERPEGHPTMMTNATDRLDRLAIDAIRTLSIVGIDHFGASAPAAAIFEHFGFSPERITDIGRRVVRDGLHGRIPTVDHDHQPAGLGLDGQGAPEPAPSSGDTRGDAPAQPWKKPRASKGGRS